MESSRGGNCARRVAGSFSRISTNEFIYRVGEFIPRVLDIIGFVIFTFGQLVDESRESGLHFLELLARLGLALEKRVCTISL